GIRHRAPARPPRAAGMVNLSPKRKRGMQSPSLACTSGSKCSVRLKNMSRACFDFEPEAQARGAIASLACASGSKQESIMPLTPITIRYNFRPRTRSLATGQVADLFGLADEEPPHVVAENVALDVRNGDLVWFTGPSGSGKSSLLREVGRQVDALDANALPLPDVPLVDALP